MSFEGEAELEEEEELEARAALLGRSGDVSTLARRSILNFVGGALFGLFGFAWLVIVARGMGAQGSGTLLEAVAFFTIATSLVVLGFDESLVRAVSRALATGRASAVPRTLLVAVVPLFAFGVLVAVVVWSLAPEIANLFQGEVIDPSLETYVRVFSLALPFTAMYYAILAATRGFGTMVPTVGVERIGRTLAQAAAAGLVIAFGGGTMGMALAWVLPFVGGMFVAAWSLRRLMRRAVPESSSEAGRPSLTEVAREFWGFSSLRGIASIFQTAGLWVDTLIVGGLLTASAAAIYTTSGRSVRLGAIVLLALVQAVAPQISDLLSRHERSRAEHVYRVSTWWLMSLTWPLYITLAIYAPLLLRIFGSRFPTGAEVVVTMSAAMLLSTAIGPVDMVLLMGGKSGWNLMNSAFSLAVNITLNFALIPHLGIEGAAIAWAVSVSLNNLLPYLEVRVMFRMTPFASPGAVPALASLISFGVVGGAVRLAVGPSTAGLAVTALLGTGLYLLLLRRFGSSLEFASLLSSLRPGSRQEAMSNGGYHAGGRLGEPERGD